MTDQLDWRVSSYTDNATCVEIAATPDGGVLIRNSNNRAAGHMAFTRAEFSAWLQGCKAGEFDDLA